MRISVWSSDVCSSDLAWRGRQPAGAQGYPLTHANASLHKCALPLFRSVGSGAINITQRKDCAWPLRRQRLSKTPAARRSEEHTSELQSLMRISYAVFCLKKKKTTDNKQKKNTT